MQSLGKLYLLPHIRMIFVDIQKRIRHREQVKIILFKHYSFYISGKIRKTYRGRDVAVVRIPQLQNPDNTPNRSRLIFVC